MKLLEGATVDDDPVDDSYEQSLREERDALRDELRHARREAAESKRETAHALGSLRKQLTPLYRALQAVFGELDAAGVDDGSVVIGSSPARSPVWDSWKSKMPGRPAQVIDALMLHGPMNSTQIAIHVGIHRNNVPQLIFKLNKAGLIDKNGTKYSLKQL